MASPLFDNVCAGVYDVGFKLKHWHLCNTAYKDRLLYTSQNTNLKNKAFSTEIMILITSHLSQLTSQKNYQASQVAPYCRESKITNEPLVFKLRTFNLKKDEHFFLNNIKNQAFVVIANARRYLCSSSNSVY
jgi:hypothetical protein